ncbi:6481_t:CDS:2 [Ambispora leptoticha]|uniref:6481_t:CDS:1 n=1 Tax=Ambispora leptoticha TaxID=144679 RepID=A0A9N8V8S9_9GLOM|nr:6481_t:CDS:2 [Ambispora leptoticha]
MRVTNSMNSTRLSFAHQVTVSFAVKLIIAFIKHLLFMRGQIPCLFSQVEKLSQRTFIVRNSGFPIQHVQYLSLQLLTNAQNLFASIETTFNHILDNSHHHQKFIPVLNFAIILGNTVTNPKEIYLLEFANVYADHVLELNENTCEKLKQHELTSERKFSRELVTAFNDEPLAPTRLHLLFRTSRNNPPPELVPKQFFKLKNTSKIPTCIIVCEGLLLSSDLDLKITKQTNSIPDANDEMPRHSETLNYEDMIRDFNEENKIISKEKDATDYVEDLQNSRRFHHHYDNTVIHDSAQNNKSHIQEAKTSASIKNNELTEGERSDEFTIKNGCASENEKQKESRRKDLTILKKLDSEELLCIISEIDNINDIKTNNDREKEKSSKEDELTKEIHDDLIWYRCRNVLIGFPAI